MDLDSAPSCVDLAWIDMAWIGIPLIQLLLIGHGFSGSFHAMDSDWWIWRHGVGWVDDFGCGSDVASLDLDSGM